MHIDSSVKIVVVLNSVYPWWRSCSCAPELSCERPRLTGQLGWSQPLHCAHDLHGCLDVTHTPQWVSLRQQPCTLSLGLHTHTHTHTHINNIPPPPSSGFSNLPPRGLSLTKAALPICLGLSDSHETPESLWTRLKCSLLNTTLDSCSRSGWKLEVQLYLQGIHTNHENWRE